MKSVGISEFRDKASQYLASKDAIAVFRYGKLVGFYIPVSQSQEAEIVQALSRLNQTVAKSDLGTAEALRDRRKWHGRSCFS